MSANKIEIYKDGVKWIGVCRDRKVVVFSELSAGDAFNELQKAVATVTEADKYREVYRVFLDR